MSEEREGAATEPPPARPDLAPVNSMWDTSLAKPRGGPLGRLVHRWLAPLFTSQAAFNSRQVQLDNALAEQLVAHEKRMGEIDERHRLLQEDLVSHVQDLVTRIDLVLSRSEKDRVSLELALRDLRRELSSLQERLPRG